MKASILNLNIEVGLTSANLFQFQITLNLTTILSDNLQ
jgi:hypothetical protein